MVGNVRNGPKNIEASIELNRSNLGRHSIKKLKC
jgi:hypothetical protein